MRYTFDRDEVTATNMRSALQENFPEATLRRSLSCDDGLAERDCPHFATFAFFAPIFLVLASLSQSRESLSCIATAN